MIKDSYRFFIAGIIQGSYQNDDIRCQSYRETVKNLLQQSFPGSVVYCPVENHPDSVNYSDDQARSTFMNHIDMVRNSDAIVVYLPEASMGSAIEMWEAWHYKPLIVTISPMRINWVVRLFSDTVIEDLKTFEHFIKSGVFNKMLNERRENQGRKPQYDQ